MTSFLFGEKRGSVLTQKITEQHLSLIAAAMAMKACSTLVASFALVSMKGMPISSAKA
jgi:hypothetical protein